MAARKRVLYFVIGGHGGQAFMEQWLNDEFEHNIILNVVDWGGSTGVIGRSLEKMGVKALPVGDLRNNIANLLQYRFKDLNGETSNSLYEMFQAGIRPMANPSEVSNSIKEGVFRLIHQLDLQFDNATSNLFKEIGLTSLELDDFIDNVYLKGYARLDEQEAIDSKGVMIDHKIGNIFLSALAYKFKLQDEYGGYETMINSLKQMRIIPENMNFRYVDTSRKDLCAINEKGEVVVRGEDAIDNYKKPLALKDLILTQPREVVEHTIINSKVIELITNADLIVVPLGSEGNTYPWLAHIAPILSELDKPIIRFTNFATEPNSFGIASEMIHLRKLGLKPTYYFVKSKEELGIKESLYKRLVDRYQQENKNLQFYNEKNLRDHLEFGLSSDGVGSAWWKTIIDDIVHSVRPVMDLIGFNGQSLNEATPEDDQVLYKGFRHISKQVAEVCRSEANREFDEIKFN